jgi:anaerobic selenocysteine-containing dehydrogenase
MPHLRGSLAQPELQDFPLKLQTGHTRYAYHVMGDDEGSSLRDIREHRVLKDGHYYLVARISREDAEARGIEDDDLIRLWNHRGSVVCAAQVTERLQPGVISASRPRPSTGRWVSPASPPTSAAASTC